MTDDPRPLWQRQRDALRAEAQAAAEAAAPDAQASFTLGDQTFPLFPLGLGEWPDLFAALDAVERETASHPLIYWGTPTEAPVCPHCGHPLP